MPHISMASVLLLVQVLSFTLMSADTDSPQSKQFTMFTVSKSWNEARHVCLNAGGDLANINNFTTQYLQRALREYREHHTGQNIWIGLHDVALQTGSVGSQGFRWTTGPFLGEGDWSNWLTEAPWHYPKTWCVSLLFRPTLPWVPESCLTPHDYLCQKDNGPCTNFTPMHEGCNFYTANPSLSQLTMAGVMSISDCQELCLAREVTPAGLCWMVDLRGTDCVLFVGFTPVYCGDPPTFSPHAKIMVRDCYSVTYNTSEVSTPLISDERPLVNYSTFTTSTQVTPTILALPSTTDSMEAHHTEQTLTSSSMTSTSLGTPESSATTEQVTSRLVSEAPTSSSDVQLQATTRMDHCPCSCSRPIVANVASAKEVAKHLQKELTVSKTMLSSNRRRKESAPDNRPSAQATGVLGILILVFLGCMIVLPDLKDFAQAIYSRYVQKPTGN